MINIDGCIFTWSVKKEYSWLPVGKSGRIRNEQYTGKCSLVLAVDSDGRYFGMIVDSNVDSEIMSTYLIILTRFYQREGIDIANDAVIFLDNARN